jgi:hypothetical protein
MTAASESTRKKLQRIPVELQCEFPDVPLVQISQLVEVLAHRLLIAAHFDNFVPLLAHRWARERLAVDRQAEGDRMASPLALVTSKGALVARRQLVGQETTREESKRERNRQTC